MVVDGEKAAEQLKDLTTRIKNAKSNQDRMELMVMLQKSPELFPELLKATKELNFCPPMQMMKLQQEEEQNKREETKNKSEDATSSSE